MDALELAKLLQEMSQRLKEEIDKVNAASVTYQIQTIQQLTRLEAELAGAKDKVETLDRVVVRGNGKPPLTQTIASISDKIQEIQTELESISKAIDGQPKQTSTAAPNKSIWEELLVLLSNPRFWLIVSLAMSTVGGFVIGEQALNSNSDNPAEVQP